jgi:hypothetical protein
MADPEVREGLLAALATAQGTSAERGEAQELSADVLTQALVREWSYRYVATAVDQSSQTALQTTLKEHYPLTCFLAERGVLKVETYYAPLIEHTDPATPHPQLDALQAAADAQLPYGVNGLVCALSPQAFGSDEADETGILLAQDVAAGAEDGTLSYPGWLKASLPRAAANTLAFPSYFVVLVQVQPEDTKLSNLAAEYNLSCVLDATTAEGGYSLIALLSGAPTGIYGSGEAAQAAFAPLSPDTSGRTVFR